VGIEHPDLVMNGPEMAFDDLADLGMPLVDFEFALCRFSARK
jgi:hypothetical protein